MDVDALLTRIGDLADDILSTTDENIPSYAAIELAEAVQDLDEYLSKGGMFPRGWTRINRIGFGTARKAG